MYSIATIGPQNVEGIWLNFKCRIFSTCSLVLYCYVFIVSVNCRVSEADARPPVRLQDIQSMNSSNSLSLSSLVDSGTHLSMDIQKDLVELYNVVFSYPSIDNHAHAFLKQEHCDDIPFEGIISEASGPALLEDAPQTLACYRAAAQLGRLFNLPSGADWEEVKRVRKEMDYLELCRLCMAPTKIQCILIDDGLGMRDLVYDYRWHDQFTTSPTKRIVRVEVLAQDILKDLIDAQLLTGELSPSPLFDLFAAKLVTELTTAASDPEVAGYKSIACYRTGLDISLTQTSSELGHSIIAIALQYSTTKRLRLADKVFNDFVVNTTLRIAGECGKPVQFHTGLGDNDISLSRSTPALMQPVIKAYPNTKFVLLHSSYPYTQEAGYLTAVYRNVYLDFGEIFPFLSADGQRDVVKEVLELAPINKIMWSTDGHFWPDSYYLGTLQAREVVYEVLAGSVRRGDLTLTQAIKIAKGAFFDNANRIYNLGLVPHVA